MDKPDKTGDIDLLIVDDDAEFRQLTAEQFRRRGVRVEEAGSGEEALRLLERRSFDVALVDMRMPGMTGLQLLPKVIEQANDCRVVLLTGEGTIAVAVEAMKQGASDFLTKPVRFSELEVIIQRAAEEGRLRKENTQLKAILSRNQPKKKIIGDSSAMQEVFRLIQRAGPTNKPILVQGESGTGKELVARALHSASPLADKPLVVINCAALPETMLESELFGHEKGAFTGAVSSKQGLFEVADGGTLFIDEIGEMTPALQVKLLRVLEDGSMRRVGSLKERRVQVRLIAATNRSLPEEVKASRFREDLYYRINVMTIQLPALRQRTGDVQLLVEDLVGPQWQLDEGVLPALLRYSWPGNVRQLLNAIERAKIMADDSILRLEDFPPEILESNGALPARAGLISEASETNLAAIKKSHIEEVLQRENGNKARTARALGVSRRTLYRLLEKFDIDDEAKSEQAER